MLGFGGVGVGEGLVLVLVGEVCIMITQPDGPASEHTLEPKLWLLLAEHLSYR